MVFKKLENLRQHRKERQHIRETLDADSQLFW
jgi:hypothetical protein